MANANDLIINIYSFSFHGEHPPLGPDGGGFVFDCRCLPNPGIHQDLCNLTGEDWQVKQFMERQPETRAFKKHVLDLVLLAIESFQRKGYSRISIAFGCTGGIHRSVWMANHLSYSLDDHGILNSCVNHLNKTNWPTGA